MTGLPSATSWEDDRTRREHYSAGMLSQLVSTAVDGLKSLDPSVRVVSGAGSASSSSSSSSSLPEATAGGYSNDAVGGSPTLVGAGAGAGNATNSGGGGGRGGRSTSASLSPSSMLSLSYDEKKKMRENLLSAARPLDAMATTSTTANGGDGVAAFGQSGIDPATLAEAMQQPIIRAKRVEFSRLLVLLFSFLF
jgi:hypothetical protein